MLLLINDTPYILCARLTSKLCSHCLNQKVTELPSHRVSRQMQPRICGQLTTSVGKANCNASAILVIPYTVPVCGVLLSY